MKSFKTNFKIERPNISHHERDNSRMMSPNMFRFIQQMLNIPENLFPSMMSQKVSFLTPGALVHICKPQRLISITLRCAETQT